MATKTADADLKTASVLAFERKLDPSDALFSAGCWRRSEGALFWGSRRTFRRCRRTLSAGLATLVRSTAEGPGKQLLPLPTMGVASWPRWCPSWQ